MDEVGNYRPICTLPTLYKLFSTTYNRLFTRLDQAQAFGRSYQKLDHLTTYRLLEQKCREWGIKMWVARVDFMKAFDSISHKSLWNAFENAVSNHILHLLPEEAMRGTERISLNGQRKRHV